MDINLASGKNEAPVSLSLSVRFHEDIIVRNTSLEDGSWGVEERENNLDAYTVPNPLIAGTIVQCIRFYIDSPCKKKLSERLMLS